MPLLLIVVCAIAGLTLGGTLARLVDVLPERWPTLADLRRLDVAVGRGRGDAGQAAVRWDGFAATSVLGTVTAISFALAAYRWELQGELPIHLLLFAGLVLIAAIDLNVSRIPDRIVFPLLAVSTLSFLALAIVRRDLDPFFGALVGSVFFHVALLVPHLINPLAMGYGDVKLALVLGLFLGWSGGSMLDGFLRTTTGLLAGCLLGTVLGAALYLVRRSNQPFPFGPALAIGTVLTLLVAPHSLLP